MFSGVNALHSCVFPMKMRTLIHRIPPGFRDGIFMFSGVNALHSCVFLIKIFAKPGGNRVLFPDTIL
jgi:hypothetical protein